MMIMLMMIYMILSPYHCQVEEETLLRVDLENRIQSLKEELAFKEELYKQVGMVYITTP